MQWCFSFLLAYYDQLLSSLHMSSRNRTTTCPVCPQKSTPQRNVSDFAGRLVVEDEHHISPNLQRPGDHWLGGAPLKSTEHGVFNNIWDSIPQNRWNLGWETHGTQRPIWTAPGETGRWHFQRIVSTDFHNSLPRDPAAKACGHASSSQSNAPWNTSVRLGCALPPSVRRKKFAWKLG